MNVDHFQLVVRDAEPVREFFLAIGLPVSEIFDGYFEARDAAKILSVYEAARMATVLGITVPDLHGGMVLQFQVDEIRTMPAVLAAAGAHNVSAVIATPWGTRSVFATGPEGISMEMYSWN